MKYNLYGHVRVERFFAVHTYTFSSGSFAAFVITLPFKKAKKKKAGEISTSMKSSTTHTVDMISKRTITLRYLIALSLSFVDSIRLADSVMLSPS